jgi:radical SAM protein with 4Fe4S-binding SPASM domain
VPVHAVWEITLACNLRCIHCGSRAGRPRAAELSTAEALDVVAALARLGTRSVSLIGGEAYLRRDWVELVAAITSAGMECNLQSGGRGLSRARLEAARDAGLTVLGISIDGTGDTHDLQRGVPGAFRAAVEAMAEGRGLGLTIHANTQINRLNFGELEAIAEVLSAHGVSQWQVQLTGPLGRAADGEPLILEPWQILDLMPRLDALYESGIERGLLLQIGNNIGFFGPHEHKLRGFGRAESHWRGCQAGILAVAIESDGTVKGCPSLPTASYSGGNVRDLALDDLWAGLGEGSLSPPELHGFCSGCAYRLHCRGGCRWTAHSLFGRAGDNPFCHYRALRLEAHGLRERLVRTGTASGLPFDHADHAIVLESSDGAAALYPPSEPAIDADAQLRACPDCGTYGDERESACRDCGSQLTAAVERRERRLAEAARLVAEVERLLEPSP